MVSTLVMDDGSDRVIVGGGGSVVVGRTDAIVELTAAIRYHRATVSTDRRIE
jgi:hypothetical protein